MAESALVESLNDDGRKIVEHLARADIPLAIAWWVRPVAEEEQGGEDRLFFVATPLVEQEGPGVVYGKVYESLRSMPDGASTLARISLGQIKVVGERDPITQDVFKILRRYPGKPPTWPPIYAARCRLGKIEAEEVHVYTPGLWEKSKTWYRAQLTQPVEISEPASPQENQAVQEILSSGVSSMADAGWWVRYFLTRARPKIPANTIVKARAFQSTCRGRGSRRKAGGDSQERC